MGLLSPPVQINSVTQIFDRMCADISLSSGREGPPSQQTFQPDIKSGDISFCESLGGAATKPPEIKK